MASGRIFPLQFNSPYSHPDDDSPPLQVSSEPAESIGDWRCPPPSSWIQEIDCDETQYLAELKIYILILKLSHDNVNTVHDDEHRRVWHGCSVGWFVHERSHGNGSSHSNFCKFTWIQIALDSIFQSMKSTKEYSEHCGWSRCTLKEIFALGHVRSIFEDRRLSGSPHAIHKAKYTSSNTSYAGTKCHLFEHLGPFKGNFLIQYDRVSVFSGSGGGTCSFQSLSLLLRRLSRQVSKNSFFLLSQIRTIRWDMGPRNEARSFPRRHGDGGGCRWW